MLSLLPRIHSFQHMSRCESVSIARARTMAHVTRLIPIPLYVTVHEKMSYLLYNYIKDTTFSRELSHIEGLELNESRVPSCARGQCSPIHTYSCVGRSGFLEAMITSALVRLVSLGVSGCSKIVALSMDTGSHVFANKTSWSTFLVCARLCGTNARKCSAYSAY